MFHYTFACQECGGTDIDIDRATLAPPREMVTATTTK